MTYAIICKARKGPVTYLALTDRSTAKARFWTSDSPGEILRVYNKPAAGRICNSLKYNDPKVVTYEEARRIIEEQNELLNNTAISHEESLDYLSEAGDR